MKTSMLRLWMALVLLLGSTPAWSGNTTASSVTFTVTGASLIAAPGTDSSGTILAQGSYPVTFTKTDPDLSASALGAISVPAGRYVGVTITYLNSLTFEVDGERYDGLDHSLDGAVASSLSNGTSYVCTTDSSGNLDLCSSGSSGVAVAGEFNTGSETTVQSSSYFSKVYCIPTDGASGGCESGDQVVTKPALYITMDMFHYVSVNEFPSTPTASVLGGYPYVTFGAPGAAIHLTGMSTSPAGEPIDVSIIFDGNENVINVNASGNVNFLANSGNDSNDYGYCSGNSYIETPGGESLELISFSTASNGTLEMPFGVGTTSYGFSTITGFLSSVISESSLSSTPVAQSCVAGTGSFLGYTYNVAYSCNTGSGTTGHCGDTSDKLLRVARIVDPNNILGGICPQSTVTNSTAGSCGSY